MNSSPTCRDFRFADRLKVRWAEVDMQKIVFNAHYLMYFDTAVAGYWRALALPYEETMHCLGGDLYVKKASIEFHASARLDDELRVAMKCARMGSSSMVFEGAIFRDDALLITCELIYVFADPSTQKSRPVPEKLRAAITGYEAGTGMVRMQTGSWTTLSTDVGAVRRSVPGREQPDDADAQAVHVVGYNALGMPVAAGRLLPADGRSGCARADRVGVHRAVRSSGIGTVLLEELSRAARGLGAQELVAVVPESSTGWWLRLGFGLQGEPFARDGVLQRHVSRLL